MVQCTCTVYIWIYLHRRNSIAVRHMHSAVTAKTSIMLWQQKWAQHCDSKGSDCWDNDVHISATTMTTDRGVTVLSVVTGFVPRLWVMTLWKIFAVDTQFKQLRKRSLKKNSGFSGIQTCDLCDTGAVLYQLSYEAITVGSRSILVGPSCH